MSAVDVLSSYEFPRLQPQSDCESLQIVDGYVPHPAFDAADVCTINLAKIRERVLTEFSLDPDPSQICREDLPESAWMRPFHTGIERSR